jgi:hypothetical protein
MLQPYAQPRSEDSVGDWVENLFFTDKNVFLYKKFFQQLFHSMSAHWESFKVNIFIKDISMQVILI